MTNDDIEALIARLETQPDPLTLTVVSHTQTDAWHKMICEAANAIATLESARAVQDAALSNLRNDLRECAIRAEHAEAALAAAQADAEQLELDVLTWRDRAEEQKVQRLALLSTLEHLEQAYANRHSPQHRAAALNEARTAIDAARAQEQKP